MFQLGVPPGLGGWPANGSNPSDVPHVEKPLVSMLRPAPHQHALTHQDAQPAALGLAPVVLISHAPPHEFQIGLLLDSIHGGGAWPSWAGSVAHNPFEWQACILRLAPVKSWHIQGGALLHGGVADNHLRIPMCFASQL